MADPIKPLTVEDRLALLEQRLAERDAEIERLKTTPPPPAPLPSTEPDGSHDLDTYKEGEFKQQGTGAKFQLKHVPDDVHGKTLHFKNKTHSFQASTVAEARQHFEGDFSKFEPKKPEPKK